MSSGLLDDVLALAAPFGGSPSELVKVEDRFVSWEWGERGDLGILRESEWRTATNRVSFFDPTPIVRSIHSRLVTYQRAGGGQPAEAGRRERRSAEARSPGVAGAVCPETKLHQRTFTRDPSSELYYAGRPRMNR